MIVRFLLFCIFLTATTSVIATEQFLINFELVRGGNPPERGIILVSEKQHTWSKGLKRSYLRLRCQQTEAEKIQKLYSTVDLFAGLSVSHQLVENKVQLTVVRTDVKPRLDEIRALPKNECKELSPIVTTVTQHYSFSSIIDGARETWHFSENATFQVTGKLMREK